MSISEDILLFNAALPAEDQPHAARLGQLCAELLPQAQGKVWHGHPVWFIEGNPIVGYSRKKAGLEVLFWSGQSFAGPGLTPLGSYQAASFTAAAGKALDEALLTGWLREAVDIQWDYANLPKKKVLEKLTDF